MYNVVARLLLYLFHVAAALYIHKLPCKYTPKTNRSSLVGEDKLKKAARMISGEKSSIRHAAETYGVDRMTLRRYF